MPHPSQPALRECADSAARWCSHELFVASKLSARGRLPGPLPPLSTILHSQFGCTGQSENYWLEGSIPIRMPPMSSIHKVLMLVFLLVIPGVCLAQENPGAQTAKPAPAKSKSSTKTSAPQHKFWDQENIALFAGVGGVRMLDYASTRHLRDQGNNEWLLSNSIVDNRPLFVGIELAGTAASIGVSYLFHRTGHHSLERWVSIAHIGVGVGGSIHNYALKPPVTIVEPAVVTQPLQ